MSDLIDRLKALIPKGDGYDSEYSRTIQEAIAYLTKPLPDDVQGELRWLEDIIDPETYIGDNNEKLHAATIKGIIERLARELLLQKSNYFMECKAYEAKVEELEAKIEELENPTPCKWYQEDDIDSRYYRTGCGVSWEFTFGGPSENGMKFCHRCGKPVSEIPVQEDETDE